MVYIQYFRDLRVNVAPLTATLANFNPLSPHDALKHHFTSLKTT